MFTMLDLISEFYQNYIYIFKYVVEVNLVFNTDLYLINNIVSLQKEKKNSMKLFFKNNTCKNKIDWFTLYILK